MKELKERLQNSWFKRLILIGECLLALAGAFAQTNTLQGNIGFDYGYLKDLNLSPLHYEEQGNTYALGYNWQEASTLNKFTFLLDYSNGLLRTDVSKDFTTGHIQGSFRIEQLRRFDLLDINTTDWAIGVWHYCHLNYLDWNQQNASSFLAKHRLDCPPSFNLQIQKQDHFSLQLHVPLGSLIAHSPYNKTDPELAFVNENAPHSASSGRYS